MDIELAFISSRFKQLCSISVYTFLDVVDKFERLLNSNHTKYYFQLIRLIDNILEHSFTPYRRLG